MQRFFVSFPLSIDITLVDPDLINQITRVLRMKIGESIVLFDGDGSETTYEITHIEKKSIQLRGRDRVFPDTEPKKSITLYQALPNKYEKIEYILQKGVEIGIQKFVFFRSDRSQKLVISPAKIERFYIIAREALEQCGGMVMPSIEFSEVYPLHPSMQTQIALDTIGNVQTAGEYTNIQDIGIWVGPEWGWSEEERQKMHKNGYIFARFWERVLRTETAWVVVSFSLINA